MTSRERVMAALRREEPDRVPVVRHRESDVRERPSGRRSRVDSEDVASGAVQECDPLVRVRGHEARRHGRDHVPVEILEPVERALAQIELDPGGQQLLGEVRHHEGDAVEAGHGDRQVEANARGAPLRDLRERRGRQGAVRQELDHGSVEDRGHRRDHHRPGPIEEKGGSSDHDEVEEIEDGVRTSRGIDEHGRDADVGEELQVRRENRIQVASDRPVEERQEQRRDRQRVEERDLDVHARAGLHEDGGEADETEDRDAGRRQPGEGPPEGVCHGRGKRVLRGSPKARSVSVPRLPRPSSFASRAVVSRSC